MLRATLPTNCKRAVVIYKIQFPSAVQKRACSMNCVLWQMSAKPPTGMHKALLLSLTTLIELLIGFWKPCRSERRFHRLEQNQTDT